MIKNFYLRLKLFFLTCVIGVTEWVETLVNKFEEWLVNNFIVVMTSGCWLALLIIVILAFLFT
jgi:hypothetical protein